MASAKSKAALPRRTEKPLRIHGSIAQDLGIAIVSGRYKPGQLLTREVEASEKLAVSRTAYREAIRILAAKGLVHSRPHIGTRVSERAEWHLLDPDVLSWIFRGEPDVSLLLGIFELRRIVEPSIAALAAERRNQRQLDEMGRALHQMKTHGICSDIGRVADRDFHAALLGASGNPFFAALIEPVTAAIDSLSQYKERDTPVKRDAVPDHERVYEAIAAKNSEEARAQMIELIRLAMTDTPLPKARQKRA